MAEWLRQACPTFALALEEQPRVVAREGKSGSRKRVGIVAFIDSPTKKTFRSWAWLGASESEEQLAAARASKSLDRPGIEDLFFLPLARWRGTDAELICVQRP